MKAPASLERPSPATYSGAPLLWAILSALGCVGVLVVVLLANQATKASLVDSNPRRTPTTRRNER